MDTPSNGQPTIGRPFDVQAKGGLRLTCAFYAECAHEVSKGSEDSEGSEGAGGGFAADYKKVASLRSGSKETRKLAAFPMDMQSFETSTHRKLSL